MSSLATIRRGRWNPPRAAQRFWHAAKLRLIDRVAPPSPGSRVADAGCGSGVIANHLARRAAEVVGFDSNPAAIDYAANAFESPHLRFVLGPFERIVDEGPFDRVYCLEVLEHLYEEQAVETLRLFARGDQLRELICFSRRPIITARGR